jgi:hypothetical protein
MFQVKRNIDVDYIRRSYLRTHFWLVHERVFSMPNLQPEYNL